MGRIARIVALSLASAACWDAIAFAVMPPMSRHVWGGVIASPIIALGAGFASVWFPRVSPVRRALLSLVSLYVAVALFGLSMGVYDLATGQNSGSGWHRNANEVVYQQALGTIYGLTFMGLFLALWPMAYANHALLAKAWTSASRATGAD